MAQLIQSDKQLFRQMKNIKKYKKLVAGKPCQPRVARTYPSKISAIFFEQIRIFSDHSIGNIN
jgi:hypothetical protein